jgi:CheY-like chemotaxis protein
MESESCPACVVLIEDDDRLRESIAAFLEDRGYPTLQAEDGEHALFLLESVERPCLVMVDPLAPRVDCTKLFAALERADRLATLPMVLVSFHAPGLLSRPSISKKLADIDILFRIVQDHCCGGTRAGGKTQGERDSLLGGGSGGGH